MAAESLYALGRPEHRGSVLGWRPGQALAVALGALGFLAGLSLRGQDGVVLAVLAALAGCVVAMLPFHGRGLDEWAPVLASHLVRVRSGALSAGASIQAPPDALAHLRWPDGRATVVVAVEHRGLRILDDEPRQYAESIATWLRGIGDDAARAWTVTLLSETGPGAVPRGAAWSWPGCRAADYVAITAEAPLDLATMLERAGVPGVVPLDAEGLGALLARRVAPGAGTLLESDLKVRWSALCGSVSLHAAFVVEEWPGGEVDEQLLSPLCVSADRRSLAVHLGTEELHRARERAARIRTGAAADRHVTAAGGFLASAESVRDDARDASRAAELAAGHGSLRAVCVVAIDASDLAELEAAAARLHADATACGVRLRRCDGDQRRGVLSSLPGWCVP
jgi:hypothetical protein